MKRFYKGHRIKVSVWQEGDYWFARSYIHYQQEPQNELVTFTVRYPFKIYDEAIEAGLAAAQKWIDKGKPPFRTLKRHPSWLASFIKAV